MKKIFKLLIILIFCFSINVNAGTNTYDREELENYGVNKNIKITDKNLDEILNTYAVNASEKIYDFGNILTDNEEKELKVLIDDFSQKYHTDVIILTDDIRYMSDYENEDFTANFFNYNDFGIEYNNSGIVLFRNTYKNDPYYNVYSFGDAQLYMSYDRVEATLNHIYDYIYNKNYLEGFSKFISNLNLYYSEGVPKTMKDYEVNEKGYLKKKYEIPWFQAIGISLIITILIMFILIKKNNTIIKTSTAHKNMIHTASKITNKRDVFLSTSTVTETISNTNKTPQNTSPKSGDNSGNGRHG